MGSYDAHGNTDVFGLMKEWRIGPIWLLVYSTHFLQALDVGVSQAFKRHSFNLRTKLTKSNLERKFLRVLYVWHDPAYSGCINFAWTAVGVHVKPPKDN
jgi:hypothetical protein